MRGKSRLDARVNRKGREGKEGHRRDRRRRRENAELRLERFVFINSYFSGGQNGNNPFAGSTLDQSSSLRTLRFLRSVDSPDSPLRPLRPLRCNWVFDFGNFGNFGNSRHSSASSTWRCIIGTLKQHGTHWFHRSQAALLPQPGLRPWHGCPRTA